MNVLVTGGAGFIGYHLAGELMKQHNVVVIDKRDKNIHDNIRYHFFDIAENPSRVDDIFSHGIDVVFHLAANSDISTGDPQIEYKDTFLTTMVILDACRAHGVKQFIFSSSSAIYGNADNLIMEDYGPLLPISHYGSAKLASEAFISSYAHLYGIKCWVCRFPNVVGDRATHGVIHDLIRLFNEGEYTVLGTGEQRKPYMHVDELIDAMLYIWNNSCDNLNVFNIGGECTTSVKEIAEMITDHEITYTGRSWDGDVQNYKYNTQKLRHLGWGPQINSNAAVKKAILQLKEELCLR